MQVPQETLNSTSVVIKWNSPLFPNGIVSHYIVYYGFSSPSVYRPPSDIKMQTVKGDNDALLVDLVPFTRYSVWVRAVNVDKNQSLMGNASQVEQFVTLVDGK